MNFLKNYLGDISEKILGGIPERIRIHKVLFGEISGEILVLNNKRNSA